MKFAINAPVIVQDTESDDEFDGFVVGVTDDEWLVYEVLTLHDDRVRAVAESMLQEVCHG